MRRDQRSSLSDPQRALSLPKSEMRRVEIMKEAEKKPDQARIAELEAKNQSIAQYAMRDLRDAGLELTAARQRIKELEAERDSYHHDFRVKFDTETKQLHARIKELETETKRLEFNRAAFNKVEDDLALMLEREQKLVAALVSVKRRTNNLATHDSIETLLAIDDIRTYVDDAIKAHRGEG